MIYDMLTRNELSELHHTLCSQHGRQHKIIMGLMDLSEAARMDIAALLGSPLFKVLDAHHREVDEMADEVMAEIKRRDAEHASYDALAELRVNRGIDA